MTTIGERRLGPAEHIHRTNLGAAGAARTDPRRSGASLDEAAERAYARLPDAPHYAAALANLGALEATRPEVDAAERVARRERKEDAEVRARLDAFRDRFAGPYVVGGTTVSARPMFRMSGGFNHESMKAHERELAAICTRAGCSGALGLVRCGRPTPEQLVRVTQALIDAGKLPPGGDDTLELRIRQMQWTWGIGVDCAGYTEGASGAARGKATVVPTTNDMFAALRANSRKIPVAEIRPGDVIHLDPPAPGDVGHNVVVYDHAVVDDARRAALAARSPEAAAFLRSSGPFHALVVDSSWGAGDGNDYGGFRRDTWIYDEGSRRWGYFDPGSGAFASSTRGPQDEPCAGAFRPRATR